MTQSVYVTRKIPGPALQRLQTAYDTVINKSPSPPSRSALLRAVTGKSAILCMLSDSINAELIDNAGPSLKVISTYSTGFEHIDVSYATRKGIFVTFTSHVLTDATADLTLALMLAAARNVIAGSDLVRSRHWKIGWMPDLLLGHDIAGLTLGIIGLGRIGTAVAKRAKAFSMNVIYHSRRRNLEAERSLGVSYVSLDELLSKSDYVSLHASINSSQAGRIAESTSKAKRSYMIDARRLKMMKKTAYLINTARGQLVDEKALARAVKNKWIAGAGLDVFNSEPLSPSSPLMGLSNVTLLPHLGSATIETRQRMSDIAVRNIELVLQGRQPETEFTVNRELLLTG